MGRAIRLDRSDLPSFDGRSITLILEMGMAGWTGYVSSKGHAIMLAPDGVNTQAVARDSQNARSGMNARAAFERWKRAEAERHLAPHVPSKYSCLQCDETFDTVRGLSSHQRKHMLVSLTCPECGRSVKYLEAHRQRAHGVGVKIDAVEAILQVLGDMERLREENEKYRKKFGRIDD